MNQNKVHFISWKNAKRNSTKWLLTLLTVGFFALLISGCNLLASRDKIMNVSFQMNEREDYPRSDQLVIWLQKPDGTFVKTLFVSEYLAYGGYNDPDICPDWSSNNNWEEVSEEEFDALTGATPAIGPVQMNMSLTGEQVPKGDYIVFVEVHLTADYNELYSGKIKVSGKASESLLEASYRPEKYPAATYDVLSDLKVSIQ